MDYDKKIKLVFHWIEVLNIASYEWGIWYLNIQGVIGSFDNENVFEQDTICVVYIHYRQWLVPYLCLTYFVLLASADQVAKRIYNPSWLMIRG